ncbi:MAG: hypothetical protein ACE15E_05090 [Acidobacteriota bacterium]
MDKARVWWWERGARPLPPPYVVKRAILLKYARQYRLRIFVETGTYEGHTVEAMRRYFDRVFSIELSELYFRRAKSRFANFHHISLLNGDSGFLLATVLKEIRRAALFWLDGHYSGGDTARGELDCPALNELILILRSPFRHVVLIDDARCFGRDPAYPSLEQIKTVLSQSGRSADFTVADDIMRIVLMDENQG